MATVTYLQRFVYLPATRAEERSDWDSIVGRVRAATARGVGTMSFTGTQDKCTACEKTVHFIDLLTADGVPYHKTCFKCSHCKGILSVRACCYLPVLPEDPEEMRVSDAACNLYAFWPPADVQLLFHGRRAVLQDPLRAALQGDGEFLQEVRAR